MAEVQEKILRRLRAFPRERPGEGRPRIDECSERTKPALRMIQWTAAAESPELSGQDESLHSVAMRPPTVPEFPHVTASLPWIDAQVRHSQKSGDAEKDRLGVVALFA